jgi:hypothetical protein
MRTTLSLDDDVFYLAKNYAKSRSLGLGKAVSKLVRKGLTAPTQTRVVNGFHVVVLPPDSPQVGIDDVKRLRDELK